MKILRSDRDKTIVLNSETNFGTDLGWEENFQEFEHETLKEIINPTENFETVRYIHAPYTGGEGMTQHDLWLEFQFADSSGDHSGGLNYERTGLSAEENALLLKSEETSFFRLEFYKIPSGHTLPTSSNRKLMFTKNYPIPMGEMVYYTPIKERIFVPIFIGSNYRHTENMYLYWFQDTTAMNGTVYDNDIDQFFISAKYFNVIDGTSITFLNKDKNTNDPIDESNDIYHRMVIDRTNYTYTIYSGATTSHRIGTSTGTTPMRWYAADTSSQIPPPQPSGGVTPTPTRTPTPTPSTVISSSPTPTPTPTISVTPTPSPIITSMWVYNDSANSLNITNITVDGVQVDGVTFPIEPGDYRQTISTSEPGANQSIVVSFNGFPSGSSSLRCQVNGGSSYDVCHNGPGSPDTFTNVPVNGFLIEIDYDSIWC